MLTNDSNSRKKEGSLLIELAKVMAGDFSNQKQSLADSRNYAHIRVFFSSPSLGIF